MGTEYLISPPSPVALSLHLFNFCLQESIFLTATCQFLIPSISSSSTLMLFWFMSVAFLLALALRIYFLSSFLYAQSIKVNGSSQTAQYPGHHTAASIHGSLYSLAIIFSYWTTHTYTFNMLISNTASVSSNLFVRSTSCTYR